MLSDRLICSALRSNDISIQPYERINLGPNSYDLEIAPKIKLFQHRASKFDVLESCHDFIKMKLPYMLMPGETILCATKEIVGCGGCMLGILSLRSNASRTGLQFQFSNLLDSGFIGVLSFTVHNPTTYAFIIKLGWKPLQIMFDDCGEVVVPYNEREASKNLNQTSINEVSYRNDK